MQDHAVSRRCHVNGSPKSVPPPFRKTNNKKRQDAGRVPVCVVNVTLQGARWQGGLLLCSLSIATELPLMKIPARIDGDGLLTTERAVQNRSEELITR